MYTIAWEHVLHPRAVDHEAVGTESHISGSFEHMLD